MYEISNSEITFNVAVIFLLIWSIIVTGIRYGKRVSDIKSYAISNNYFNSTALICTIAASFIGGGLIIGNAENCYQEGIWYTFAIFGFAFNLIFTGIFVAPRIEKFKGCLSVGDMLEAYYGRNAKILAGITWLMFCTGMIIAQTSAISRVFSIFLDWPMSLNAIVGVGVVVAYSYFGGIRSVVATDVLQFAIMIIAIPMCLYFALDTVGGLAVVKEKIPVTHLEFFSNVSPLKFTSIFLSFFIADALVPPILQRMLMATTAKKARTSMIVSGLVVFLLCGISGMFGLVTYALNPNLEHQQLMPYLFDTTLPAVFKGIAISGLIAVIMSTADSYLNSASIALAHDIIKPCSKKEISETVELKIAKRTTILIGCVAVLSNMAFNNITSILLATYGTWGPSLLAIVAGVIFNKKIPIWGFYTCFISGMLVKTVWGYIPQLSAHISGLMPGVITNISLFIIIYLIYGENKTENETKEILKKINN